jgi:heptaprenyl diphosphate synthase
MKKDLSTGLCNLDFLKKDLDRLEDFLVEFTGGLDGILHEAVKNTLIAGGKRIRPSLFLICAKDKSYDIDYLLPAAAAIEIIHTASLIHDDIIDKSILRRGKKTIHHVYDKDTAKYVGDYLFTHTFSLLNTYENARILAEMSEAAKCLVKGEFDQLKTKRDIFQSEELYFAKINEKTSSLFKVSCVIGGVLSGAGEETIENMRKFGEYLGISFQINDDLIDVDIHSTAKKEGKPVGKDFKQGDITLPFIYGMDDNQFREKIESISKKQSFSDGDLDEILKSLLKTDAINRAKAKFFYYVDKARETAGAIEGNTRCACLVKVCEAIEQGTGIGR